MPYPKHYPTFTVTFTDESGDVCEVPNQSARDAMRAAVITDVRLGHIASGFIYRVTPNAGETFYAARNGQCVGVTETHCVDIAGLSPARLAVIETAAGISPIGS